MKVYCIKQTVINSRYGTVINKRSTLTNRPFSEKDEIHAVLFRKQEKLIEHATRNKILIYAKFGLNLKQHAQKNALALLQKNLGVILSSYSKKIKKIFLCCRISATNL